MSVAEKLNVRRPVLVTGAHRSGTTWLGTMLAASGRLQYISEPLNVGRRPSLFGGALSRWYTYICEENAEVYRPGVSASFQLKYRWWNTLSSIRSARELSSTVREGVGFMQAKHRGKRALVKDPFAVFSTPWISKEFECDTVIIIRHPFSYVSSLKRLGWCFQIEDLLAQPLLVRDWLAPFEAELFALSPDDLIGRAATLWKVIYSAVQQIQQIAPNVIVVQHEELSLEPLQRFQSLYKTLQLPWSAEVEAQIEDYTNSSNPKQIESTHSVRVDSINNLNNWKKYLSPHETQRIRHITGDVLESYYPNGLT